MTKTSVVTRLRRRVVGAAGRRNRDSSAIGDERYAQALGMYAAMVGVVIQDPERWLGAGTDMPVTGMRRIVGGLRRVAFGSVNPGSPAWHTLPVRRRVGWWTRRISLTAGSAAAAPRFAGLVADRFPVQASLGASAAGLAVCATAYENGVREPEQWVPLLGKVVLGRPLDPARSDPARSDSPRIESADVAERELTPAADDLSDPPGAMERLGDGSQRAVRTLWQLARVLLEVQGLFDERPRGGWLPRIVGKVPVIGVAAGWLDERGGIRRAAHETQDLLDTPGVR